MPAFLQHVSSYRLRTFLIFQFSQTLLFFVKDAMYKLPFKSYIWNEFISTWGFLYAHEVYVNMHAYFLLLLYLLYRKSKVKTM